MRNTLGRRFLLLTSLSLTASTGATTGFAQTPAPAEESVEASEEEVAQAARMECLEAHRSAQQLKLENKFVEARQYLKTCSAVACPGVIIKDCAAWVTDLEEVTPSMVFQVHLDGTDASQAQVEVDGILVEDRMNAVQVNPGQHTVVATVPGMDPITQTVSLPVGQRMRLVSFNFKSTSSDLGLVSPPEDVVSRPRPAAVYPLLGLGVAGLAAFGVFTGLGMQEQNELEDGCAPTCTDEDLSKMKTMYLIGDISAGVGAAALVTAGIVYLTRPKVRESAPRVSLSVDPAREAFGLQATGRF